MFSKNSAIYIAGHEGLLGSALLHTLKEQGYNNLLFKTHKEVDLTCQASVADIFKSNKIDFVFMAAGLTGGILANKTYPAKFMHVNIAIQDNIFESALASNVKACVFYASSCMYPKKSVQPIKEEYLLTGPIEETSEAYACAKIAGLKACKSYNKQYGKTQFICLLPNSIFGPNDNFDAENSHVLSSLMRRFSDAKASNAPSVTLWGSGKPRREFVYSHDIALASIFALQHRDKLLNTHYNIGTGQDHSINEYAQMVARIAGYKGNIEWDASKPDGTMQKLLDSSLFYSLGWKPRYEFLESLKNTYEWYLKNKNGGLS